MMARASGVGAVLVALLALPQWCRSDESNYERLKAMEWVTGTWRQEWKATEATPTAKKGDAMAKEWRFAWTPSKNAMLISQAITANGKSVGAMDALFGWDEEGETITGGGFASKGVKGDGWTIEAGRETFTITAGSSDWTFKKKDENRLTVTAANGTVREFVAVRAKSNWHVDS